MSKLIIFIGLALAINLSNCNPKSSNALTNVPESYDQINSFTSKGIEVLPLSSQTTLKKIGIGSCNHQDKKQPLWGPIIKNRPDLWIWLGDNIYGDTEDMAVMKKKYDKANNQPGYKQLKTFCPIIGTWDDHDFGVNDGDKTYPKSKESKQLLLDFLGVKKDAVQRKRAGVYTSYTAGAGPRQVKIIILDTRTFKDPVAKKDKAYIPDPNAKLLGDAQWKWLEKELNTSKAAVNIIANGTQIIANEHRFEKWGNFPTERKRLFKLLAQSPAKGIMLVSGDRHKGEFSKIKLGDKVVYEFTSSGMTHVRPPQGEPSKYRDGAEINELNFGIIQFHWDKSPLQASLQIRGRHDKLLQEKTIELN